MRLDLDKLEDIRTALLQQPEGFIVEFGLKGEEKQWCISSDGVFKVKGDDVKEITVEDFINEVGDRDVIAYIFFRWDENNREVYGVFEDWDKLANYLGISGLEVLSTKVPKIIAKRFEYFASMESNKSDVLRKLVLEYVKKKWVEEADKLIFESEL